jgi:hypothetical protein
LSTSNYALFWLARDEDGNISYQGCDVARTLISAQSKIGDKKNFARIAGNLQTFWCCVIYPDGNVMQNTVEFVKGKNES